MAGSWVTILSHTFTLFCFFSGYGYYTYTEKSVSEGTLKCHVFLIISYVFSSTQLEKRAEQVLPGSEGGGGRRERWPKQCIHI
jgi:hypothetical protein